MNELIKVATNADGKQVVSARELHSFLEAGSNINTWFKNQVERAMLEIGIDFIQISEESTGGRPSNDYAVSLQSAKEISMLNGGSKGKQARLYFIECEKQLQKPKELSRLDILTLALESEKRVLALESQALLDKPKVEFAEQLLSSTNAIDFSAAAKGMNLPFGRTTLFKHCRDLNILRRTNEPYQEFVDAKYFVLLETSFLHPKTQDRILTTKTMITAKGEAWLLKKLRVAGLIS